MKGRLFLCGLLLLMPLMTKGQPIDTSVTLTQLANELKSFQNMGYSYEMGIKFPNGEKDQLKGTIYLDNDDKLYFNDCDAFVMLYTSHWFYKADHRNKTLTIIDLDKEYDKKLKKATEKDIFQNGAVITFIDSVLLKTAKIKKLKKEGDWSMISLVFPKTQLLQKMDIVYNTISHQLKSYDMTVAHPFQKTPKGVQVIESRIRCSDFVKTTDKSIYLETNFFSHDNKKIEPKKYNNYKLLDKM